MSLCLHNREISLGMGNVGNAAQGASVALSSNGNTALVGGPDDNTDLGAVWMFTVNGTTGHLSEEVNLLVWGLPWEPTKELLLH